MSRLDKYIFRFSEPEAMRQPPPQAALALDRTSEKCYNDKFRRSQSQYIFEFPSPSASLYSISQLGGQGWR